MLECLKTPYIWTLLSYAYLIYDLESAISISDSVFKGLGNVVLTLVILIDKMTCTEIGRKARLFDKLQPGRAGKRINST